ncbi:hypothetical protein ABZ371_18710 [Streptomyces sp. NPDC005899]|uniref:hypothetical protein n=1 Tax=Streptomyces sp. NPDC005899 TaxID=3155716 RepID=UPI0033E65F9D
MAPVVLLLDRADAQLAGALTERARETAAAEVATQADEYLRILAAADGKGWIALRLAGTSRTEHRQLTLKATQERATALSEAAEARAAAFRAAEAAWSMIRSSPYATGLGAIELQAPDVDAQAIRLTEMRGTMVPARIQQIDTGDERRASRAHGQAAAARGKAAGHRAVVAVARAEQALRVRIAEHHPSLHRSETRARAEFRQAHETGGARVEAGGTPGYRPLSPGRTGPSRGGMDGPV